MAVRYLELDALVRSIEVNSSSPHAFFLGAGASLTSGVPSAGTCVLQWKRSIFESNNSDLKAAVAEISLPSVQTRVDDWLKTNGIWPDFNEDDYSFFIEKCLPILDDRRRFFQRLIQSAKPHIGYQLLALLADAGIVRSVWTTNFDGLTAKAMYVAAKMTTPIEIGIDCQHRLTRQPSRDELLCVSMHGDYRYDKLKNTETELQNQEAELSRELVKALEQQTLIVSGYSGRDKSIMSTLEKAIVTDKPKENVFWCGYSDAPEASVATLLDRAHQVGREAFYVSGVSFDELMIRLSRQCLTGEPARSAETFIGTSTNTPTPLKLPFVLKVQTTSALIKGNLFPLKIPAEVYSFALKKWPEEKRWKWLRARAIKGGFHAVPLRNCVLALATLDQLKNEFGDEIDGTIDRTPITSDDLVISDGAINCLIRESLVKSLASARALKPTRSGVSGKGIIVRGS